MKLVSEYLADALKFERSCCRREARATQAIVPSAGNGLSQVGREEGEGPRQAFGSIEPVGSRVGSGRLVVEPIRTAGTLEQTKKMASESVTRFLHEHLWT
jgi:hypothetical protein